MCSHMCCIEVLQVWYVGHQQFSNNQSITNLQKLQAAKKKEFLGDYMDMKASSRAMDFLNRPDIIQRMDDLLSRGSMKPEERIQVRR